MSWSPDPGNLDQLAQLLEQSVSPKLLPAERNAATASLEAAKSTPDFNRYLVYMLICPGDRDLRATAGMVLKNNISPHNSDLSYVKEQIVAGLADADPLIRNISAITTTTILSRVGVANWYQVLETLIEMTETGSPEAQHGAMSALAKVCEDSAEQLNHPMPNGSRPLDALVPRFIEECSSQDMKIRANAVFCLTQFISLESQSFLVHLNSFMQALFTLAEDPYPDTRRNIALAFNALLTSRADKLAPHLDGIVAFCLHCMRDNDDTVQLQGAEFVLTLAECYDVPDSSIEPQVPKIVPLLLEKLVYSDMDIMVLEGLEEDDENVQDKATDVRPAQYSTKAKKVKGPEEDESEDEDDLEASLEDWNLRKCSGACLDALTTRFAQQVMQVALPHLRQAIASDTWPVCESAVLAFGAVATGCLQSETLDFLPELVPYLTKLLTDSRAPVRDMCCWTLGRYGQLICMDHSQLQPVLQGVLRCGLDKNKKVQKSGCHALSVLSECAGDLLVPYIEPLLNFFQQCFQKYQLGNMMALFECIQSVVTAVSYTFNNPTYLAVIVDPILQCWQAYGDEDRNILPLLECLSAIATFSGDAFAPYAPQLFLHATQIMEKTLVLHERFRQDPLNSEVPELEFLVCALDLVSGIIQGLQDQVHGLIASCHDPSLLDMLRVCMTNEVPEVHMSAFAVIGDMATYTFEDLKPAIDPILRGLIVNIDCSDPRYSTVSHNAIWASGEIALQMKGEMEPYFAEIFERLGTVLLSENAAGFLRENAAIVIGRLGIALSQLIAPHLKVLIDKWLASLMFVDETLEKDTAYQGLCVVIMANPTALNESQLVHLLNAFAQFVDPTALLKELVVKVISGYRSYLPNFDQLAASAGPEVQRQLRAVFGV